MKSIGIKRIVSTLTLLGFTAVASAQYIWLDEKGGKQYSDMPPPASVPKDRILKQPGRPYLAPQSSSDNGDNAAGKSAASADKASAPMTLAEKNAEFNKRKAKQAEQEAKAAEEAKNAANKAKNCDNARSYYRSGLPGSLSGRKSDAAWDSAFRSIELGTGHLLQRENSPHTRMGAARAFEGFYYDAFPAVPALRRKAARRIRELGGNFSHAPGGRRFKLLAKCISWPLARRLQLALRRLGGKSPALR